MVATVILQQDIFARQTVHVPFGADFVEPMRFAATSLLRAIPTVFARLVCLVRFLTGTAVPATGRTDRPDKMSLFAFVAKPRRFARLISAVRFVTARAKPHFLCVITLRLLAIRLTSGVFRSARRTTPGILSEGIFGGMNRFARFTRPAPVFTGHQQLISIPPPLFREMNAVACVAPPGRLPNTEFVRLGFFRTNRLLMFHVACRAKPCLRIRSGKSDNCRRRKPL
jgi:hypothetical protein